MALRLPGTGTNGGGQDARAPSAGHAFAESRAPGVSKARTVGRAPGASGAPTRGRAAGGSPPGVAPAVYVAIGASDTFGYGVPDPATQGWVPQFAAQLPDGTRVVNLGVVGLTLHRALQVDLPVAIDAHPTLITIWLAVNDLLDGVPLARYQADLHILLSQLHRATGARILIGNVPALQYVPAAGGHLGADPVATIGAWNAAIAQEAAAVGATVVDLYSGWQELAAHPEYVGPDGLHPSMAGYARVAALFVDAL